MRPLMKWPSGIVFLPDEQQLRIPATFNPYSAAKSYLIRNFGLTCSYCEKVFFEERDLHVEHIQPKGYKDDHGHYIYVHLENNWDNFLLSCATCNGSDNKDTKNVEYGHCHLPHLNNTLLSLKYDAGGVVTVNPQLLGASYDNAEELLKLVGLDKTPSTSSKGDKRWKIRLEKWELANRYLNKYLIGKTDVDTIVDLVKGHGCWSIWFTVFRDITDVRKALVEQFPGTARNCFDANYYPVPRNPMNISDPI